MWRSISRDESGPFISVSSGCNGKNGVSVLSCRLKDAEYISTGRNREKPGTPVLAALVDKLQLTYHFPHCLVIALTKFKMTQT